MNLNNYSEGFKSEWERLSAADKNCFESILDQYKETFGQKNVRMGTEAERHERIQATNEAIKNLAQAVYEVESRQFKSAE